MASYKDIQNVNSQMIRTPIHGKNYAEVPQRVQAFRCLYPEGFIITDLVSNDGGVCVMKTTVGYYQNGEPVTLATGMAYEKEGSSNINRTSYIENCETSAVGRALGMLGLGSEASIASAEEVATAIMQQKEAENQEEPVPDKLEPKAQNADRRQVVDAVLRQTGITKGTFNAIYSAFCKNVLKAKETILLSNLDDNTFADAILYINEQLKKGGA